MKRTFQPSKLVRARRHGFRSRMATKNGRRVISARRAKGHRLKKRSDFLLVQQKGRKWISKGMIVEIYDNNNLGLRCGLTVSKKVSKLAILRNRVKRRIRAVSCDVLPEYTAQNLDIVLIGRIGTQNRQYEDLCNDLRWCLKKMEILPDLKK
ncbi:unnamed protein product [Cyprideis torosa]|uniref:Large ribosomal subunit protein bL34m n=1 Tax=Cyprideis torosa TaxID=163714 RepID=A0A7R8ZMN6_9CRUS|nr:unnamed protein product [Cyprideis torosa]CAG0895985.1 unnamed protein product [Cyprideis torosa]